VTSLIGFMAPPCCMAQFDVPGVGCFRRFGSF
jgi:hypothetical protein